MISLFLAMLCYALLEKMKALVSAPAFANLLNVFQTERQSDGNICVAQRRVFSIYDNYFVYLRQFNFLSKFFTVAAAT